MATTSGQQAFLIGDKVAGEDLSGSQYKFVKLHTDGTIMDIDASTDIPLGVLQNKPKAGQSCTVLVIGQTEVRCGAANITFNDTLTLKADGAVTEKGTGTVFVGRALEAGTDTKLMKAYVNVVPNPVDATA